MEMACVPQCEGPCPCGGSVFYCVRIYVHGEGPCLWCEGPLPWGWSVFHGVKVHVLWVQVCVHGDGLCSIVYGFMSMGLVCVPWYEGPCGGFVFCVVRVHVHEDGLYSMVLGSVFHGFAVVGAAGSVALWQ